MQELLETEISFSKDMLLLQEVTDCLIFPLCLKYFTRLIAAISSITNIFVLVVFCGQVYVTDMSESPLFTQADVKIVFTNLADVVALTLDFIAFLTPACGGGIDEEYDDSTTFVGEAFSQTVTALLRKKERKI